MTHLAIPRHFNSRFGKPLAFVLLCLLAGLARADLQPTDAMRIEPKGSIPLKLYVFDCGHIEARDLSLFNPLIPKGTQQALANPCYLIRHPEGTLFWDAGLADRLIENKHGVEVLNGAFKMSVSKTLASQLAEIGVDPATIDFLAFSHLHNDHSGNARLFARSTWLVQAAEYQLASSEQASQYGYQPGDYTNIGDVKMEKLRGHHDVFKDGSVVILATPGHTPGHQSLFVDLPKTGPVVISGDLYHFKQNRENYGIPVWNSKRETIQSFALIDNFLEKTKASLWIQHDKEQFDKLKHAPKYYE